MKKHFYIILLVIIRLTGYAQQKVIHHSPEAASLLKVSQNEVSLQAGMVNVGIPIFNLSEGGLNVPIGLNYTGSGGIKVDEAATWVGLGWDLSAGGSITRVVRDKPDESYTMNSYKNEVPFSIDGVRIGVYDGVNRLSVDWENDKIIYRGGWKYLKNINSTESSENDDFQKNDPMLFDTYPDLYIANMCGEIVKFTFDNNGTPVVLNNKDVKITYDFVNYDPSEYYTKREWSLNYEFDAFGSKLIEEGKATAKDLAKVADTQIMKNKLTSVTSLQNVNAVLGIRLGLDWIWRKTRKNKNLIGFRKWILTASNGVEYHFGEDQETNDPTYIDFNFNYQNLTNSVDRLSIAVTNLHSKIPSTWHLNKIVSPFGEENITGTPQTSTVITKTNNEIKFTYDRTGMYLPYHNSDIVLNAGSCDFPQSKQDKINVSLDWSENGLIQTGLKVKTFADDKTLEDAKEVGLSWGVNYSQIIDKKAFLELNTMVVYGKNLKTIESKNFKVIFNDDELLKNPEKTSKFKDIIPSYNFTQFSETDRIDIQGEYTLSTQEINDKSQLNLGISQNGIGLTKKWKTDNWEASIGAVTNASFTAINTNASIGFTSDDRSFTASASLDKGVQLAYQGKIYIENLNKPYLHPHYALKNIKILDKNTLNTKAFYFDYDYFNSTSNIGSDLPDEYYGQLRDKYNNVVTNDKFRLKLKGIYEMIIEPTRISILPGHTFEYNTTQLPRRLSFAMDHWGYYNGEHENKNKSQFISRMIYRKYNASEQVINENEVGDNLCPNQSIRDAKLVSCKAGVLEKINYPTGGFKQFKYELHSDPSYPKPIGGLRIQEIITNDPVLNKTYSEKYEYKTESGISSGFLSIHPEYYFSHLNSKAGSIVHADYSKSLLSEFANDGFITYKRVINKQVGNGYTVTEFNNNEDLPLLVKQPIFDNQIEENINAYDYATQNSSAISPISGATGQTPIGYLDINRYSFLENAPYFDYSKGSIKKISIFTEDNKKVSETEFNYTSKFETDIRQITASRVVARWPLKKLGVGVSIGIFFIPIPPFISPSIGFNAREIVKKSGEVYNYYINVGKFHLKEQVEKSYDLEGLNPIVTSKFFEYSQNHHEVVKEKIINSNGDIVENNTRYSFDLNVPVNYIANVQPRESELTIDYQPNNSFADLNEYNMNLPIEQYTTRNGSVISGKLNIYNNRTKLDNNLFFNQTGLLKEEYVLQTTLPISINDYFKIDLINKSTPGGASYPGQQIYKDGTRQPYFKKDPRYDLRTQYQQYNDKGLLVKSNKYGFPSSRITYGFNNLIPIKITQETSKGERSIEYEIIPLFGVTKTKNPDGTELRYKYDLIGRLLEVRDINGKLLKSYTYNYKTQ
jgi:YD repeat-containing protein